MSERASIHLASSSRTGNVSQAPLGTPVTYSVSSSALIINQTGSCQRPALHGGPAANWKDRRPRLAPLLLVQRESTHRVGRLTKPVPKRLHSRRLFFRKNHPYCNLVSSPQRTDCVFGPSKRMAKLTQTDGHPLGSTCRHHQPKTGILDHGRTGYLGTACCGC